MEQEPNAFVRFNVAATRKARRRAITNTVIAVTGLMLICAIAGYYNILGNWTR